MLTRRGFFTFVAAAAGALAGAALVTPKTRNGMALVDFDGRVIGYVTAWRLAPFPDVDFDAIYRLNYEFPAVLNGPITLIR